MHFWNFSSRIFKIHYKYIRDLKGYVEEFEAIEGLP